MKKSLKLTRCALLCAAAVVLSMLESALPVPIFFLPGCRLGLANLAVIVAIPIVGSGGAVSVCVVKSLFILVARGVMAGFMSFCGGAVSLAVMLLLFYIKQFGYVGVSIASAAAHNTAQLAAAALIMWDIRVFSFLWLYLLLSIAAGTVTGFVAGVCVPPLCKVLNTLDRGLGSGTNKS